MARRSSGQCREKSVCVCVWSPLQVEAQVSEHGAAGQEGAARAGQQLPVAQPGAARRLRVGVRV